MLPWEPDEFATRWRSRLIDPPRRPAYVIVRRGGGPDHGGTDFPGFGCREIV